MGKTVDSNAATKVEPYMTMVFLPACRACGDRHPLAYNPPRDAATCPGCGQPAGTPGEPHTEKAEIVGPISRFLNFVRKASQ